MVKIINNWENFYMKESDLISAEKLSKKYKLYIFSLVIFSCILNFVVSVNFEYKGFETLFYAIPLFFAILLILIKQSIFEKENGNRIYSNKIYMSMKGKRTNKEDSIEYHFIDSSYGIFSNGKLHNLSGSAISYADGRDVDYYIAGVLIPYKNFIDKKESYIKSLEISKKVGDF
mgnify:CR=1 FL=1